MCINNRREGRRYAFSLASSVIDCDSLCSRLERSVLAKRYSARRIAAVSLRTRGTPPLSASLCPGSSCFLLFSPLSSRQVMASFLPCQCKSRTRATRPPRKQRLAARRSSAAFSNYSSEVRIISEIFLVSKSSEAGNRRR